ncbi:MAG: sigma-70 family RNA polymerase sigma factor [Clostridiales bacterium]|nr:sigma-70 family RNA polymerase sigma factor [Clostridiales bacterium]
MELLIKKAMKGDAEAFVQLMELNEVSMYKTAKAILANEEDIGDAIQETILAAYKNIHTLKKAQYFKTWLIRILINKCKDIIKKNQKIILIESYAEEGCDEAINAQLEVDSCLEMLSSDQQTVLNLYYHQGFNTREIAELLGENENTVKSRLTRAKSYFKKIFLKSIQGGF